MPYSHDDEEVSDLTRLVNEPSEKGTLFTESTASTWRPQYTNKRERLRNLFVVAAAASLITSLIMLIGFKVATSHLTDEP